MLYNFGIYYFFLFESETLAESVYKAKRKLLIWQAIRCSLARTIPYRSSCHAQCCAFSVRVFARLMNTVEVRSDYAEPSLCPTSLALIRWPRFRLGLEARAVLYYASGVSQTNHIF